MRNEEWETKKWGMEKKKKNDTAPFVFPDVGAPLDLGYSWTREIPILGKFVLPRSRLLHLGV